VTLSDRYEIKLVDMREWKRVLGPIIAVTDV
jgi:hypothetical protein